MSFRQLYKNLQKELNLINKRTHALNRKKDLEKRTALLNYKKLQLAKDGKPSKEVERELEQLANAKENAPPIDHALLKELVNDESNKASDAMKLNFLNNATIFLRSQRIYTELLERYNPGLSMTQEENVRKTANRVGLSVPEDLK